MLWSCILKLSKMIRYERVFTQPSTSIPAGASLAVTKTGTFNNANLADGVTTWILSITHNLNRKVIVEIYDPSGIHEATLAADDASLNKVDIDFGGSIGAGDWVWKVIG